MKLLLIDDHQIFIAGLSLMLSGYIDTLEIISATNRTDTLHEIDSHNDIDLIILDLNFESEETGLDILQTIRTKGIQSPALILLLPTMQN